MGRVRSRRHKAILVNKAARPVGRLVGEGDSVGLRLPPPLPLPRPDPITQLFLSLNNLLSLFGEVSSSLYLSLSAAAAVSLSHAILYAARI